MESTVWPPIISASIVSKQLVARFSSPPNNRHIHEIWSCIYIFNIYDIFDILSCISITVHPVVTHEWDCTLKGLIAWHFYCSIVCDKKCFSYKWNSSSQHSPVVQLNVGGHLYSTSLSTLRKHPDSKLAELFIGQPKLHTDPQGRYFIDRDGRNFRAILEFLRSDLLPTENIQEVGSLYVHCYNRLLQESGCFWLCADTQGGSLL